jgi:hypothetical protein
MSPSTSIRRGDTLYVFGEPTTGLHPADKLMAQLDRLVETGNTVIVAEHEVRVVAGSTGSSTSVRARAARGGVRAAARVAQSSESRRGPDHAGNLLRLRLTVLLAGGAGRARARPQCTQGQYAGYNLSCTADQVGVLRRMQGPVSLFASSGGAEAELG